MQTPSSQPQPSRDLKDDLARAAETWGERAAEQVAGDARPLAWSDSPLVQEMYINPLVSGQADMDWLRLVRDMLYPIPVKLGMTLGCGIGLLERHAMSVNVAYRCHGFDLSAEAVAIARAEAERAGFGDRIDYFVADLNVHEFGRNVYDVVFGSMSIHHIHNLERLYEQVKRCLRRKGRFILCEFVGPNQFQWTDKQLGHAQRLLERIPERLRINIRTGELVERVERQTIEEMNRVDPTEAVRSEDILPLLEEHFRITHRRDYGGTLLQITLENIVGNFEDNEEDRAILAELCRAEHELIQSGELTSDYTVVVAEHKRWAPIRLARRLIGK